MEVYYTQEPCWAEWEHRKDKEEYYFRLQHRSDNEEGDNGDRDDNDSAYEENDGDYELGRLRRTA